MSVLDELREELETMLDAEVNHEWDSGFRVGVKSSIRRLDAFEAAHPGLVDRTIHCTECGAPGPEFPKHGWTGLWVPDDGEHFRCPACSEKEEK